MTPRLRISFVDLLAGAVVGVYLLVLLGATTAITDAAAACPTWPACEGRLVVPLADPALAVAWAHRAIAALVGVVLIAVTSLAWTRPVGRRVRFAIAVAVVLYPLQVGLGAVTAVSGTPPLVSGAHLTVGMGIFAGLVAALGWTLSPTDGTPGLIDRPEPRSEGPDRTTVDPTEEPVSVETPTSSRPVGVATAIRGYSRTIRAYYRLTKPRLMWLLCLVAGAAMALAGGPDLTADVVVKTLGGGVLAIGASGTFNHVLERDVDRRMARTADRPVVTDQIPVRHAVTFGVVLAAASLAAFWSVNALAAVLGLSAIVFYSLVYTLVLKPNTVQNTVIGGFAGSLPALIGWAAVTGEVGIPGIALAGLIFLWTPAHFYNLALAYREDYARGGFPMISVVRGDAVTRQHVLWYLGGTFLATAGLAAVTDLGWLYALTGTLFGGVFLAAVVHLHRERSDAAAMRAFHASNAYLGALLVAIVVDALAF